ncbi:MAG: NAD-binding protein [Pseudomonadales bacterium]|nr:NAD-binding protein [Pseudomonadales bacterium]
MKSPRPQNPSRSRNTDTSARPGIDLSHYRFSWRWPAAALLFLCAFGALLSGVALSERPDVTGESWLAKAYYSLGLFVVGGLDIGTPVGGTLIGRALLWIAYFGAPLLMASAVIDALLRAMAPHRWQLRRLRNHVVIVGAGSLTVSYLRVLRRHRRRVTVVVVDDSPGSATSALRAQELQQSFNVTLVAGDISHEFLQRELQIGRASQIIFLGDDDFQAYEAASKVLHQFPDLQSRIVLHSHNLRFMRSMQDTRVAQHCTTFNAYHLAAKSLVDSSLLTHFQTTRARDVVVIAGFGRFGQTVMEELEAQAERELEKVVLIDIDANRRVQVAEEQQRMGGKYPRVILQGDISHPEVWRSLRESVDLSRNKPTVILGTGSTEDNLRTALWIKRQFPNTMVFARTNDVSELALEVGLEHDINAFSIEALVEDNLPLSWLPSA